MKTTFTLLQCGRCGWHSKELTREELARRGLPWYCDDCGATGLRYMTFEPHERVEAYYQLGLQLPNRQVERP